MTIFGPRSTPRYVLREGLDEVDAAEFAGQQGWRLTGRDTADAERGIEHDTVWMTLAPITFHYHEDLTIGRSYVYFEGDAPELETYRAAVLDRLQPATPTELLADVAAQPPGPRRTTAALVAGIGSPMDFDQEFFDVITDTMSDPEPDVRVVGVIACTYSPWPEYRRYLNRMSRDDPEEEVRDAAQAAIRAFDELGVEDS